MLSLVTSILSRVYGNISCWFWRLGSRISCNARLTWISFLAKSTSCHCNPSNFACPHACNTRFCLIRNFIVTPHATNKQPNFTKWKRHDFTLRVRTAANSIGLSNWCVCRFINIILRVIIIVLILVADKVLLAFCTSLVREVRKANTSALLIALMPDDQICQKVFIQNDANFVLITGCTQFSSSNQFLQNHQRAVYLPWWSLLVLLTASNSCARWLLGK